MPHYCGPSSPEFTPSTNILLPLIEQQFFVTYCQDSVDEYFTDESFDGLRHIQWKSFIEGFVEKGPTSRRLVQLLQNSHPEFFVYAVDLEKNKIIMTTFPGIIDLSRASKCVDGKAEWRIHSACDGGGIWDVISHYDSDAHNIFERRCVGIVLCSSEYGGGCAASKLLYALTDLKSEKRYVTFILKNYSIGHLLSSVT